MERTIQEQAQIELAKRALEKKYTPEREDLIKFMQFYFKNEKKQEFWTNWHYDLIAEKLYKVLKGEITRLIINIPPRHGKTELITKCFPIWTLGNYPEKEIMATWYSTTLTQEFSSQARDYYTSESFQKVFPRHSKIRQDQNTKEYWKLDDWGSYYATGTWGSITGKGANIFIIDDPIKPDEAESDVKRLAVNNWFDNTVTSRLNNPLTDAIVVIMQRTHENDLCWHLIEKMNNWTWDDWDVISLPSIAEENEEYREKWDALFRKRFPVEALEKIKSWVWSINFECQYQQNPTSDATREFHPELFQYYDTIPTWGRVFTTCDPAFAKKETSDYSAITTVKFLWDKLYILEQTVWRYDPGELEDQLIYHIKKWSPQQCGIEAFQAQTTIGYSLRTRLWRENLRRCEVVDVRQPWDKLAKIRWLIPLYRNGQIFHCKGLDHLEDQLLKFPRAKHDDAPDSLQMCLYLYEMQPNVNMTYKKPIISHDKFGNPRLVNR